MCSGQPHSRSFSDTILSPSTLLRALATSLFEYKSMDSMWEWWCCRTQNPLCLAVGALGPGPHIWEDASAKPWETTVRWRLQVARGISLPPSCTHPNDPVEDEDIGRRNQEDGEKEEEGGCWCTLWPHTQACLHTPTSQQLETHSRSGGFVEPTEREAHQACRVN